MPPVLWGKEIYTKHRDVVDGLFKNSGAKTADAGRRQTQHGSHIQLGTEKPKDGGFVTLTRPDSVKAFSAPRSNIDLLEKTQQGAGSDLPLADTPLLPGAKDILSPSFSTLRKDEKRNREPALAPEQPANRKGAAAGTRKSITANPFSLEYPQLHQQAELLEHNPIRARQLILAAGRDPGLFRL